MRPADRRSAGTRSVSQTRTCPGTPAPQIPRTAAVAASTGTIAPAVDTAAIATAARPIATNPPTTGNRRASTGAATTSPAVKRPASAAPRDSEPRSTPTSTSPNGIIASGRRPRIATTAHGVKPGVATTEA